MNENLKAVVRKVFLDGKNGPYAVAAADGIASITFSLQRKIWRSKDFPEVGDMVHLSNFRDAPKGWRAMTARFWQPSDEKQQKQPKQQKQRKNQ